MKWPALWPLLLAVISVAAQARDGTGCTEDIERALRAFGGETPIEGEVVAAHCKPWPPSNGRQVAAVMDFRLEDEDEPRGDWAGVGVVALLDATTHRVIQGRRFAAGRDGSSLTDVGSNSFEVDTANYLLAPGKRALGLRYRNAARIHGAADNSVREELVLLLPWGRELKPIFCLPMHVLEAEVGSISYRRPGAYWRVSRLTLAIGPRAASGWSDLLITETQTRDGAPDTPFDATPTQHLYTYRHDGKGYRLLESPAPSWADLSCDSSAAPPR